MKNFLFAHFLCTYSFLYLFVPHKKNYVNPTCKGGCSMENTKINMMHTVPKKLKVQSEGRKIGINIY